jgi:hypothetical protein
MALSLIGIPASNSAEKSAEYKAAFAQMRIVKDTFNGVTWYHDKSTPKYRNSNAFELYFGTQKGSNTTLRLVIQYYGSDWLFIEKYLFNVDGYTYEINPGYGDVETDNDSKVWEWFDTKPNKGEVDLIKRIIKSKKAVMRIEGSQYYKDVTISSTQKKAFSNVLTVYAGLGGK